MAPIVAIVGRPNVGKSTLMNRIVGRREAIVEEKPGVTRDRKEVDAEWAGRTFRVVDTGGWSTSLDSLDEKVSRQAERAAAEADVVLLVVDATVGITDEDAAVAELLRRGARQVLLVANKVDDVRHEAEIWDLLALGVGDPYPISALHGRNTGDLLDAVVAALPPDDGTDAATAEPADESEAADKVFSVAIVGRPNVGKSTLFNRLIGEDRAVVHDLPGTTRDSVDTVVETEHGPIRFVDTAGMRRRAKIDEGTEYYSLVRALQSVDRSDVALLVIDVTVGVTAQDQRLAERVDAAGCPVVILLNKWELLDAEQRADILRAVGDKLRFVGDAPVLRISAATGRGVHKLLPVLADTIVAYHRRVPTRQVNEVIRAAQARHPAPGGARVLYATQGAPDPPTFTLFTNRELPRSYLRFLENELREVLQLGAVPVKLRVRRRS